LAIAKGKGSRYLNQYAIKRLEVANEDDDK
jgi:hypothetical protein